MPGVASVSDTAPVDLNATHALPLEGLDNQLYEFVKHIAEVRNVPIEVPLLSALTIMGAAVGGYVSSDIFGYTNRPGLWCMVIAPSASGKTMPLKDLMNPLERIDAEMVKDYADSLNEWRSKSAKGENATPRPAKTQCVCAVATDAGRVEFLCDNKRGGIFYRDELKAMFDSFKGAHNIDARNRFCELSDFGSVKMTTKTDDDIKMVRHAFLPILGTIQPGVLPRTFSADDIDQGLLQRFIVVHFSSLQALQTLNGGIDKGKAMWWDSVIRGLRRFGNTQWCYTLSDEAKAVYAQEHEQLNVMINAIDEATDEAEDYKVAAIRRSLKFVHRVALILQCYKDYMAAPTASSWSHATIDGSVVRWAFRCVPFIIDQQMKVYYAVRGDEATKRITDAEMARTFERWHKEKFGKPCNRSALAELMGIKRQNVGAYLKET